MGLAFILKISFQLKLRGMEECYLGRAAPLCSSLSDRWFVAFLINERHADGGPQPAVKRSGWGGEGRA